MRGNNSNSPKIAKFRSAEISSVYIIACDNPDANHKIVSAVYYYDALYFISLLFRLNYR
jgi:hypothetical protein